MEDFEKATNKFLEDWKDKDFVVGALVCGSFITGNPSKYSDIDLHIILSKDTKFRERGNKIIDGFLIEYFANPIKIHYDYLKEDLSSGRKATIHMFSTGKVLFDKTGELTEFKQEMVERKNERIPALSKYKLEITKYFLFDNFDNLKEVIEEDKPDYLVAYFSYLFDVYEAYSLFKRVNVAPRHKVFDYLNDEKVKSKYFVENFDDEEFVLLMNKCFKLEDRFLMLENIEKLKDHVIENMGGLKVDGFKFRSDI
jgi:predicted nucleotidyltransferase